MREIAVGSGLARANRYRFRVLAQSVGKTPSLGLLGAGVGAGFGVALAECCFIVMVFRWIGLSNLRKLHFSIAMAFPYAYSVACWASIFVMVIRGRIAMASAHHWGMREYIKTKSCYKALWLALLLNRIFFGVSMFLFSWLKAALWDTVVIKLQGKRVVILGARAVGKTHLISFLSTGTLPLAYKQTLVSEKVPARRVSLGDLDLRLTATTDVSGDKSAYGVWRELVLGCPARKGKVKVEAADVVIYLLRADRILGKDISTEVRVRADIKHIAEWLKEAGQNRARPQFIIAGTHCDMDPDYSALTGETQGDYSDKFSQLAFVQNMILSAGGTALVKLALGSMATRAGTEELTTLIFKQAVDA